MLVINTRHVWLPYTCTAIGCQGFLAGPHAYLAVHLPCKSCNTACFNQCALLNLHEPPIHRSKCSYFGTNPVTPGLAPTIYNS
jgi:hypothetical protein